MGRCSAGAKAREQAYGVFTLKIWVDAAEQFRCVCPKNGGVDAAKCKLRLK